MSPKKRNERKTAFSMSGLARKLNVKIKKIRAGTVCMIAVKRLGVSVTADVRVSKRDRIPKIKGSRNLFSTPGKKLMLDPFAARMFRMPNAPTTVNATGKARSRMICNITREIVLQSTAAPRSSNSSPDSATCSCARRPP